MSTALIVGIDGSRESNHAVAWAVREAVARGTGLRIVHAIGDDGPWDTTVLAQAVERARQLAPDLGVTATALDGDPVDELLALSENAPLIVIGNRGVGGFAGLVLGSVAHALTLVARCPVVTVPDHEPPLHRQIVVGVSEQTADGDPEAALEFAFAEAELHAAAVLAVHVWSHPTHLGPHDLPPVGFDADVVQADESALVAQAVRAVRPHFPGVEVEAVAVPGHPVRVLARLAATAALLVVGRRAEHSRIGAALGSVAHGALGHAVCPIAIIPTNR